METLTAAQNLPFTIALVIVMLLGVLEVVGLALGGISALGIDGPEMDGDFDLDGDGFFADILGWLHVGQLPATIIGIVFLLSFGVSGLVLQNLVRSTSGAMLPAALASLFAFLLAIPATRLGGGVLKRVLPRDETEAVSRDSFLGCEAQITIGVARRGRPAEARLRDKFGRSHYVMVEPDSDEGSFAAGSHVLILKKHGDIFRVMDINGATIEE
jgi:hypothetical protein